MSSMGAYEVNKQLHKIVQGNEMRYGHCAQCRTLYANPRLTVDSLRTLYSSQEFFEGDEDNLNYYSFLGGEEYLRSTAGQNRTFPETGPGTSPPRGRLGGRVLSRRGKGGRVRLSGHRVLGANGQLRGTALGRSRHGRIDRGNRARRRSL